MNRKEFIQVAGSVSILLANGRVSKANKLAGFYHRRSDVSFRFAVASDGHFGEPNTDFTTHFGNVVSSINKNHAEHPFEFAVINGDIVHDDKSHYPAAKAALDQLHCRYYVTQGNHDHVTPEEWEAVWKMPVNYDFTFKDSAFLFATTSNEKGGYLCPDIKWFNEKLKQYKNQELYIFIHINPGNLTANAVDCPELFSLLGGRKNVRAVFNGHDHDEDGMKVKNNIPFLFDSHFGGSWGTDYRGFRIVEIMKDRSVITYVMNPDQPINKEHLIIK